MSSSHSECPTNFASIEGAPGPYMHNTHTTLLGDDGIEYRSVAQKQPSSTRSTGKASGVSRLNPSAASPSPAGPRASATSMSLSSVVARAVAAAAGSAAPSGSSAPSDTKLNIRSSNAMPPNFGNDYSSTYVRKSILPQSWIQNIEDPLLGYPKLQRLHRLKREHFASYADSPVSIRCSGDRLAPALQNMASAGAQFDVVMLNGCVETFDSKQLRMLPIGTLAAKPSLLFFWVPSSRISEGRDLMQHWGFRRGEDIVYIVNSLDSVDAPQATAWNLNETLLRPTTWHCLMGLKGTLRRSTDSELINCNTDTDVIVEQAAQRASIVPEQIYSLVENFTNMNRKIHIVPSASALPVRPRPGWVIMAPTAFDVGELNLQNFMQRSPIPVNHEIDLLRPQTPPPSNQR